MSGICGIINFNGAPVEQTVLQKMTNTVAYRGPDGIRYWRNGKVGIAHLALNITPESYREEQPLVSQQNDLVLTADARIDNRSELIEILSAQGHLQADNPTDADLILAAYRCWGTECPAHLIGDFAFAIWDIRAEHLFAARDPMGMRAFYYRTEPQRLIFGTQVQQILAAPEVPARIYEPAVGVYLVNFAPPLDWTYYEGIMQLPPAHALVVNVQGHRVWRYWDIDPDFRIEYTREEDYTEHFLSVFQEAVQCRLRSTKPVGILLSGGMDSGSIAAMAGWLRQQDPSIPPMHTYSWAYQELTQCDERHISDTLVKHYNFPATYIPAEDNYPLKDYMLHPPDRDEPLIGIYQTLLENALATAKDEGMGSVFSGIRGDLTIGPLMHNYLDFLKAGRGQGLWQELLLHSQLIDAAIPQVAWSLLLRPILGSVKYRSNPDRIRSYLARNLGCDGSPSSPDSNQIPDWIQPEFAKRIGLSEILEQIQKSGLPLRLTGFGRQERYEYIFYPSASRTMVWPERSLARYGLSFADPWSDPRIASFVIAIPQQLLDFPPRKANKQLARKALKGIMPEEFRQAAQKTVPTPLSARAFQDWAKDSVSSLLTNSKAAAYGYIDEDTLRFHQNSYCRGEIKLNKSWSSITLEMWLRNHWN